jgi:peptide methionine sulfoxide reductase MsrA
VTTELLTVKIQNYNKDLKKTKEIKFGGGDVWGTTSIFNNADSSITKVLVLYDAGEYGNVKIEYLIVDNKLIYQRDSVLAEVINKSTLDSDNYKLHETVSYFNNDSTGTRTSKSVYSMTVEYSDKKRNELMNKTADSVALEKTDYIKALNELKEALYPKSVKK